MGVEDYKIPVGWNVGKCVVGSMILSQLIVPEKEDCVGLARFR